METGVWATSDMFKKLVVHGDTLSLLLNTDNINLAHLPIFSTSTCSSYSLYLSANSLSAFFVTCFAGRFQLLSSVFFNPSLIVSLNIHILSLEHFLDTRYIAFIPVIPLPINYFRKRSTHTAMTPSLALPSPVFLAYPANRPRSPRCPPESPWPYTRQASPALPPDPSPAPSSSTNDSQDPTPDSSPLTEDPYERFPFHPCSLSTPFFAGPSSIIPCSEARRLVKSGFRLQSPPVRRRNNVVSTSERRSPTMQEFIADIDETMASVITQVRLREELV